MVFYRHILKEEELLKRKFGKVYISYQKRTKMLIPFDRKKMEEFYISLAKSLEKEIFK